ncbi:unnamed protein product [Darwinula stevensoni]|uniref:Uncharacterized protein n=1 Tax=Darwinula stevensoni TaxID=69355 RepID=A0A7R8ZZ92_9CRUS|nr:unnamed protein product [Darwinula stevensoni]CAG0883079.1 unnamed protein product [Darwinula stevensoni]
MKIPGMRMFGPKGHRKATSQVPSYFPERRRRISIQPWLSGLVPVRSVHSHLRLQSVIISKKTVRRPSTMIPAFSSQLLFGLVCIASVSAWVGVERLAFDPEHQDTCRSEKMGEMKKDEVKFDEVGCFQAVCSISENVNGVKEVYVHYTG